MERLGPERVDQEAVEADSGSADQAQADRALEAQVAEVRVVWGQDRVAEVVSVQDPAAQVVAEDQLAEGKRPARGSEPATMAARLSSRG